MTVNSDAHAALADADDVDPRYGGPRQWDQWVKDARKSVLEAVGLFGVGIAAFAFDANSASPRLAGWLFWLVLGFTVWFGFAIINRAFKWREAIRDRRCGGPRRMGRPLMTENSPSDTSVMSAGSVSGPAWAR